MKDIDCLLVTGAGASRDFGNNNKPLPLMKDWATHLVGKLREANVSDYVKLSLDMEGPEFEKVVGEFLRQFQAFQLVRPILTPSARMPLRNCHLPNLDGALNEWYDRTVSDLKKVIDVIYESLYEFFSPKSTYALGAREAYESLFKALELDPSKKLVVATTNYDVIIESVLSELGFIPDCGETHGYVSVNRSIRVQDILEGLSRTVPVLHLHGKVGWIEKQETDGSRSQVFTDSNMQPQLRFGETPLVKLPDLDKNYDGIFSDLWSAFSLAVDRAKSIVVLGHSLHDELLVKVLRSVESERIACTYVKEDGAGETEQIIQNSQMVEMKFGRDLAKMKTGLEKLQLWNARLKDGE